MYFFEKRMISAIFFWLFGLTLGGWAVDTPFLDIVGYDRYDADRKVHIFETKNGYAEFSGEATRQKKEVLEVADPAYDQVFKCLFTGSNKKGGYSGKERLMSLLNSIFYPDAEAGGVQIREIDELPTVYPTGEAQSGSAGELRMDIACRCYCYQEGQNRKARDTVLFNVEMQTSKRIGFFERLYKYGKTLREFDGRDVPTYALGFLITGCGTEGSERSGEVFLTVKPLGQPPARSRYDGVTGVVIDLSKKLALMHAEEEDQIRIEVADTERLLGTVGKQWLSLLGMRGYLQKVERNTVEKDSARRNTTRGNAAKRSAKDGLYLFPVCDDLDKCVRSSLDILRNYSRRALAKLVDDERKRDEEIKGELGPALEREKRQSREEGRQEGLEQGRKEEEERSRKKIESLEESNKSLEERNSQQAEQIRRLEEALAAATREINQVNVQNAGNLELPPGIISLLSGEKDKTDAGK